MSLARAPLALSFLALAALVAGCKPNRGAEIVDCTPGAHIWVGCNQACSLGTCSGDPWMLICDGDTPIAECDDDAVLIESDDASEFCYSTCPLAELRCPASGHITVTLRGYPLRTSQFTCDWRVEERPPHTPGEIDLDAGTVDAGSDAGTGGGADAGGDAS